jgi:hypothetical protein
LDQYKTVTLCRMFREGRWSELLDLAKWREVEAKRLGAKPTSAVDIYRAAKTLMEVGEYSKAMHRLTANQGSLPPTGEVAEKLLELHPTTGALSQQERTALRAQYAAMLAGFSTPAAMAAATSHAPPDGADLDAFGEADFTAIQLTTASVKHAFMSAPKGSAGAGTGWLYEHIKGCCINNGVRTAELTEALQVVAQGRLPAAAAGAMGTSTLVALAKEDNGIRPVAIGEVLTRLAGRAVCHQKRLAFEMCFTPLQYGVMTRNGAEQVRHTITAHMHQHPGHVLLSLDATNAFNTVKRSAFLQNILAGPPEIRELFPMVAQFYLQDADLLSYGAGQTLRLKSTSGSRQGDPLGPFLFSVAIQPALLKVQASFRQHGVVVLAYMDDIYVLGPAVKALDAFRVLKAELKDVNLEVNTSPGKCWAHCPVESDYAVVTAPEPNTGFRLQEKRTYKVLGVYDGVDAAAKMLEAVSDTAKPRALATKLAALQAFAKAGHASLAMQLLLACAAPSINYALRAGRPEVTAGMAAEADKRLLETFAAVSNIDSSDLAPGSRAHLQLRIGQDEGGVGMPSPVTLSQTAYLASWAAVGPLVAARWPHLADTIAALDEPAAAEPGSFAADLATQRDHCVSELGLEAMLANDLYFSTARPTTSNGEVAAAGRRAASTALKWQRRFAAAEATLAKASLADAVEDEAASLPNGEALALRAWHNGLTADGRACFLHSMPTPWLKPLQNDEFEFAIRRLLRLKLRGVGGSRCACGTTMDGFGDHADGCQLLVGERHDRHRMVNLEGIYAPARQAKLSPTLETSKLVADSNGRPADTGIRSGHGFGAGVHACYDCVGVGTCAASYVASAARYTGGVFEPATRRKLRNTKVLKGSVDLLVIPMAFESQGGLHPNWRVTYKQWAQRWGEQEVDRPPWRQGLMVRSWIARTSLVVQREQYKMVARLLGRAHRKAVGEEPRAHRPPRTDDFDCVLAALPPLEAE